MKEPSAHTSAAKKADGLWAATTLERRHVIRPSTGAVGRGAFSTSSHDKTVVGAISMLNKLKDETRKAGDASALLQKFLMTRPLSSSSDRRLSSTEGEVDDDERSVSGMATTQLLENRSNAALQTSPLVSAIASPSATPQRHMNGANSPKRVSDAPHSSFRGSHGVSRVAAATPPQSTVIPWKVLPNETCVNAVRAVEESLAAKVIVPLQQHSPSPISAEPHTGVDPQTEIFDAVPEVAVEALRQDADWLQYWGNVRLMHRFHESLIQQLGESLKRTKRATDDNSVLEEQLAAMARASQELQAAIESGQAVAQDAIQREKARQDGLEKHNELLSAKIVEMRRQVALADRALRNLRDEMTEQSAQFNKCRRELETIHDQHRVELLQLRQEYGGSESTESLRRVRLEVLEIENARKDETIVTLNKTIEVLTDESRRQAQRIEALSAAAELAAKPAAQSAMNIDASAIQQMTAKQYQRREAELSDAVTRLRAENDKLTVRVDTLRDHQRKFDTAAEGHLMSLHDYDGGAKGLTMGSSALALPSPLALSATAATPNSKGKGKAAAGGPKLPYECRPFVFPPPSTLLPASSPLDPAGGACRTGDGGLLDDLRSCVDKTIPDVYAAFQELVKQSWQQTERLIPQHPNRDPNGEREKTHCWMAKSIEAFIELCKRAVGLCDAASRKFLETEAAWEEQRQQTAAALRDAVAEVEQTQQQQQQQEQQTQQKEEAAAMETDDSVRQKTEFLQKLMDLEEALAGVSQAVDIVVHQTEQACSELSEKYHLTLTSDPTPRRFDGGANLLRLAAISNLPETLRTGLRFICVSWTRLIEELPVYLSMRSSPTTPETVRARDANVSVASANGRSTAEAQREDEPLPLRSSAPLVPSIAVSEHEAAIRQCEAEAASALQVQHQRNQELLDALRTAEANSVNEVRLRVDLADELDGVRRELLVAQAKAASLEQAMTATHREEATHGHPQQQQPPRVVGPATIPSAVNSALVDALRAQVVELQNDLQATKAQVALQRDDLSRKEQLLFALASDVSVHPQHNERCGAEPHDSSAMPFVDRRPNTAAAQRGQATDHLSGAASRTRLRAARPASAFEVSGNFSKPSQNTLTPLSTVAQLRQRVHHQRAKLASPSAPHGGTTLPSGVKQQHVVDLTLEASVVYEGQPSVYARPILVSEGAAGSSFPLVDLPANGEGEQRQGDDRSATAVATGSSGNAFSPAPFIQMFGITPNAASRRQPGALA